MGGDALAVGLCGRHFEAGEDLDDERHFGAFDPGSEVLADGLPAGCLEALLGLGILVDGLFQSRDCTLLRVQLGTVAAACAAIGGGVETGGVEQGLHGRYLPLGTVLGHVRRGLCRRGQKNSPTDFFEQ